MLCYYMRLPCVLMPGSSMYDTAAQLLAIAVPCCFAPMRQLFTINGTKGDPD